mgnify:CR=1 FL=1
MPTPREHILTALADLLRTLPHVPVLRGEVLPERISPAGLMILRDGDPGDPAVTLSPLAYHYQHRAELEVIVQGEARSAQQMQGSGAPLQGTNDRDSALAALCAQIGAVIRADWRAPIGWSNLIVSALSASGPLERRSPVQVVDTPERYAA